MSIPNPDINEDMVVEKGEEYLLYQPTAYSASKDRINLLKKAKPSLSKYSDLELASALIQRTLRCLNSSPEHIKEKGKAYFDVLRFLKNPVNAHKYRPDLIDESDAKILSAHLANIKLHQFDFRLTKNNLRLVNLFRNAFPRIPTYFTNNANLLIHIYIILLRFYSDLPLTSEKKILENCNPGLDYNKINDEYHLLMVIILHLHIDYYNVISKTLIKFFEGN